MGNREDIRLFLLGASNVSGETAKFCNLLGFQVIAVDDDPARLEHPLFADCTHAVVDFEDEAALEALGVAEDDMVCVITRGHKNDPQAFAFALKTPAFYKGMMGSAKKNAKCFAYALEHGCTQEQIDSAFAPIGEEIGASDGAEIGLSIAAQLVRIRNEFYPQELDKESLHAN